METHHPPKFQPVATIQAGQETLSRADWNAARSAFEEVLLAEESPEELEGLGSPEELEGLGIAAWWLEDDVVAIDARKSAYRLYSRRGDRRGASGSDGARHGP
jgi:LuxR family transcriptional regulator, maltose regulon positive regulatory protein